MLLTTIVALGLTYRLYKYLRGLHETRYLPGIRPLFDPAAPPGNFIPTCWFNYGFLWTWILRNTPQQFRPNHEILTSVPLLVGSPFYYLRSVETVRQFLANEVRNDIIRPASFTTVGIWGHSVASHNGEDWKRHRRAIVPSFNQAMFTRVTEETTAVYNELVASQGWSKDTGNIVHINPLINRFTFVILCRCGFGIPVSWTTNSDGSDDAIFEEALATASETFIARVVVPKWLYRFPIEALHKIDYAWNTVITLMAKFAERRRSDLADHSADDGRIKDVFTRLVLATDDAGKHALDISEVAPNMLTLLFAGHETTSSALLTTMAMLAIFQDKQELAYQEIIREFPHGAKLTTDVCKALRYVAACIIEANRLVPVTTNHGRETTTMDIAVTVTRPAPATIVIPKGSRIVIDQLSIHHDPISFPNPDVYDPSRFLDNLDTDLPMTVFGAGPRACLGRKFAMTEMPCFIALFLRDWKIDIAPDMLETAVREALKGVPAEKAESMYAAMSDGEKRQRLHERFLADATQRGTAFALGEVRLCVSARR
ncbi:hypothetical protein ID866_7928 [Astraeus odoratus]|nr:hypothetical protein ID866_7928 [Astraeus odoratus]